jgi:hypothetical protein
MPCPQRDKGAHQLLRLSMHLCFDRLLWDSIFSPEYPAQVSRAQAPVMSQPPTALTITATSKTDIHFCAYSTRLPNLTSLCLR